MDLFKSIATRLMWVVVVLFGLSVLIFCLLRVMPGDPARMALGPAAPEEVVERYREINHLRDPLPVQYGYWLAGVLRGDFGTSTITKRPVLRDLSEFAPATIELVIFSGIPPIFFALFLGVTGARYNNRWPDYIIRFFGYIFVATPAFVLAVLLLLVFGYWFPLLPSIGGRISAQYAVSRVSGLIIFDTLFAGQFAAAWDAFLHILLPSLALAVGPMMQEARITRSAMIDNSGKDYIAMAISQGIPKGVINSKFLLKPSVIPTVSIMGLDFASRFGNAFLVESIFNWPGLSRYGINAMMQQDINATCAVVMVLGVVFVTVNIIVDIVVMILDPRMRQQRAS
ncbi:MAG: ABC transporter permease [Synergistaceae bacterium]|nr:ABC transporter permease [Synergistaceae bacterium]